VSSLTLLSGLPELDSGNGFFRVSPVRLPRRRVSKPSPRPHVSVYFLYQNVRGLMSKLSQFRCNVQVHDVDIIAVTETWLDSSVFDSELFDCNYIVFRRDRATRGGGIMIAIRNNLVYDCKRLNIMETINEDLWVEFMYKRSFFIICVVYFPPNSDSSSIELFFDNLLANSNYLFGKNIVIFGDFNPHCHNTMLRNIDITVNFFNLKQINNVPNAFNGILDYVLINDCTNASIIDDSVGLVEPDSYHPPLSFYLYYDICKSNNVIALPSTDVSEPGGWVFRNIGFPALNSLLLSADWDPLYRSGHVDESLSIFYRILYDSFDYLFVRRLPSVCNASYIRRYPPWFDSNIIQLIRRKHSSHRLWKRFGRMDDFESFRSLRTNIKSLIFVAHRKYVENCVSSIRACPKKFWGLIHAKRKALGALSTMHDDNADYSSQSDISEAFADFFSKQFTRDDDELVGFSGCDLVSTSLCIDSIFDFDVEYAFDRLKALPSCGPDMVPDYILKGCSKALLQPLLHIFNLSLSKSTFPTVWKCSKVVPIFKSGDKSHIHNYRPVSIISSPSKIFEIVICRYLWNHFQNFVLDEQHAFRPSLSTTSNLMVFTNFLHDTLDHCGSVHVVYTDFHKAFDRLSHTVLLRKLSMYGCSDGLVDFFKSYLLHRKQFVSFGAAHSNIYPASSGVPQGSNLGPILFNIFINDIGNCITNCRYLIYADDLKLFLNITSEESCNLVQADLDALFAWSRMNRLPLSVGKCKVMSFSRSRSLSLSGHQYRIGAHVLDWVDSIVDLGVSFRGDLSFIDHINSISVSASRMLGFVMRNSRDFHCSSASRLLYKSLVRCIMEYASIVWCPYSSTHINVLELVQKRFLRSLYKDQFGFYPFLFPSKFVLGMVGFTTLAHRRDAALIKFLFLVLRGYISCPPILSSIGLFAPEGAMLTRHRSLFFVPHGRTTMFLNSPMPRGLRLLNAISAYGIDVFKISFCDLRRFLSFGGLALVGAIDPI
jgi:Reverse transcriptase (RNA-dependent DNA polymerase)